MLNLKALAQEVFSDLTVAERALLETAPVGKFAICGPNGDDSDPANHPQNASGWGNEREIRADLIRWICVNPTAKGLVDRKGIQIYGAKLIGALDLSQLCVPFPLALFHCRVTEEMLLRAIEIPLLAFDGSWVSAVKADGANVKGGVTLRNGFQAEKQVRFHRARIGVDLDCGGGSFMNLTKGPQESALAADGATVGGGVFLNRGFKTEGVVRLSRAQIRDDLDCSAATFHNGFSETSGGSGIALNADGINVGGSIFLRGVRCEGEVRLPRAKVRADIDCGGARVSNPFRWGPAGSPSAITIEGSDVGGSLIFNNQFHAQGFVTLRGAQIGGQIVCSGATFENQPSQGAPIGMPALDASQANVALSVVLGPKFRAEGEVRMQEARIGTVFQCANATFSNPPLMDTGASGYALTADGISVKGRFVLGAGFCAEGEVFLIGAQISGDLDCGGGQFNNPPQANMAIAGRALSAHRITVGGNVFIRAGFSSKGDVNFAGASIGGNLEATSADFRGELNLEAARVKGALMLSDVVNAEGLQLTLTNASVGALADERASWPPPGTLQIDGFTYERFSGPAPKDQKSRLDWLALQKGFLPRPYRQVAKVMREEGENAGSIEILYELERRVRARELRRWHAYLSDPVLRWTVGYGYYPTRAFWWLSSLILLGIALYGFGYSAGSIVPTDKDTYPGFKVDRRIPAHYERFHASVYSVENSLPFVKLGQVDHWQADPWPQSAVWQASLFRFDVTLSFAALLLWFQWLQILAGWVLGTLFIAGVTGIIRKE